MRWAERATTIRDLGWGPRHSERDGHLQTMGRPRDVPNSNSGNTWAPGGNIHRIKKAPVRGHLQGAVSVGGKETIQRTDDDSVATLDGSHESFPEDAQQEPAKIRTKWYSLDDNDAEEEVVVLAAEGDSFELRDDKDDEKSPGPKGRSAMFEYSKQP
ncbi:hypothetical protein Efla_001386 [Eimeria flavescens]